MKTWFALCRYLGLSEFSGEDRPVGQLTLDSRQAQAGDVFLALPGESRHGVLFASQAKEQGAWVLSNVAHEDVDYCVPQLAERLGALLTWFYDDPCASLQLVGITGTNGKTSTSHYIAQWLDSLGVAVAVMGTVGNGRWGSLTASSHTTLDVARIYAQLAQWRDAGVQVVVMEVSSHAIVQQRIAGLSFAVTALTQVSRDHLDYHGSLDAYYETKARLFTQWSAKVQVLNADDTLGAQLLTQLPQAVSYAIDQSAQWHAVIAQYLPSGVQLCINHTTSSVPWQGCLPVYGRFNVENILCALACVHALGMAWSTLQPLLTQTQAVVGRMQRVQTHPNIIIDYAHTPDALEKVLLALSQHLQQGRLWLVFGAGGDRDQGKRPLMGSVANRYADVVYVTDDNPRSEVPAQIAASIMQALDKAKATYIADRAAAICRAVLTAKVNDVVLIAGKGHEDYQEIAGVRYAFSDYQVVQTCQR